jgi:hypothetical protein
LKAELNMEKGLSAIVNTERLGRNLDNRLVHGVELRVDRLLKESDGCR